MESKLLVNDLTRDRFGALRPAWLR